MPKLDEATIKNILKYNVSRPYFGTFTASNLSTAYANIRVSSDWDNPITSVPVRVGTINGDVICDALWNEMSYNPVRFGDMSPFLHNGKNNIYHFCSNFNSVPTTPENYPILATIRGCLIEYMTLNAAPNGAWNDELKTTADGFVTIEAPYGFANNVYKKLACLRDSLAVIARQNVADFSKKRGPYRSAIIAMVALRHPDAFRSMAPVAPIPTAHQMLADAAQDEEIYDDKYFDMLDNAAITMDNRAYVSDDLFAQAKSDHAYLMQQLENQR